MTLEDGCDKCGPGGVYRMMKAILGAALMSAGVCAVAGCGGTAGVVTESAEVPPQRGFTSIPNLKTISKSRSYSICSFKGTSVPAYCRPGGSLHSTRGFEQVWEPRSKARKSGEPSQVVIDVFRTPSVAVAKHYSVVYAHTAGYTALPGAAINNGIAARINSLANNGRTEFRFAWTSGRSMVAVNIIGAGLTLREAQAVARRARPV